MKEKLTRNIGLKILSVILAAILWLVITNMEDPIKTKPFNDVTVRIVNEDAIKSLDLVYDILEGATVDFTVAARRSIVDKLTENDFTVTADFAKLSDVNAVAIEIQCPKYGEEVTIRSGMNQVMKINPEKKVSKNFKVTVLTNGHPADGYFVGEKTANTIVTVSGPESKIARINEIVATVNVEQASENLRSEVRLRALDEEGEEIDAKNLSFSVNSVTISVGIYKTKEINLTVKTVGTPKQGYVISGLDYEPKSIEVAGKDEALNSINELTIEEDVTDAAANIEKEVNLQEQLPEGLFLVAEDQMVVVNVTIEKAETKEISVWPSDIRADGLAPGMHINFLSPGPFVIKVTGPSAAVKDITRNNLKPYINVTDYSVGTYNVPIEANLAEYSTLTDKPMISVYVYGSDGYDQ